MGTDALSESFSDGTDSSLLSLSLHFFLGFLPCKVLALTIHNNSNPALHLAALEGQVISSSLLT